MQAHWKILVTHDDHEEPMQMVARFGYCLINRSNVGRRGRGHSLRMRMPVTDKVESVTMHFIDLPLFLAAVWMVQISRPMIHKTRTGDAQDRYFLIAEACEE